MLTAPSWTYSAAGGPNPFIVPARGGVVAAAINTESGATIVGLGRRATRFSRPLKLEARGVAIFAQPAPGSLPEHVWAVGYSTSPGVAPRLVGINRDGDILFDIPRPELSWRDGRTVSVTETPQGTVVLHTDDRHMVLSPRGEMVAELARPGSDAGFAVDNELLFAFDTQHSLSVMDLTTGAIRTKIAMDGRPSAIRPDVFSKRLAVRMERVLISMNFDFSSNASEPTTQTDWGHRPVLRALVGGLYASPTIQDGNLRSSSGPPAGLECLDDDGVVRWSISLPSANAVFGSGFFVGGEVLLTAGERVVVARDGEVIFERPRAGVTCTASSLAKVGDRAAIVVAPGAKPSSLVEFSSTIDVVAVRGGGAVAFERSTQRGPGHRMLIVDLAGAIGVQVTEGGAGARWAASSDGLIAVPRTNAARIDLYDTGAPA